MKEALDRLKSFLLWWARIIVFLLWLCMGCVAICIFPVWIIVWIIWGFDITDWYFKLLELQDKI